MAGLRRFVGLCLVVLAATPGPGRAGDRPGAALSDAFPSPEEQGGWRTLLPAEGPPDDSQKARIRQVGGMDWDALKAAWEHNAAAPGATGLLVIRRGWIVGEWYKGGDRTTAFNIYSSSKSYTSTAYGLILSDFGNGPLPGGKTLSLDTKVCNAEWLPESLPLPDPRKAEITVRHLLNMASGLDVQNPPTKDHPFEWSLGHVEGSPMARLKNDPGAAFHYSNAGVAHLVLAFHRAAGEDLYPFLKRRLFDPIGETQLRWTPLGGPEAGEGAIGPFSQGYSGIYTNPRQHCAVLLPGDAQGGVGRQADRPGVVLRLRLEGEPGQSPVRRPVVDLPPDRRRPERPGHDPGPQPQRRVRRPQPRPGLRPARRRRQVPQGFREGPDPEGPGRRGPLRPGTDVPRRGPGGW